MKYLREKQEVVNPDNCGFSEPHVFVVTKKLFLVNNPISLFCNVCVFGHLQRVH